MKKWQKAKVRWFDNLSGEGMIRVGKKSIFVHWSAIANGMKDGPANCFKRPKLLWCVLFPNQDVQVQIIEDYNWTQISKVRAA